MLKEAAIKIEYLSLLSLSKDDQVEGGTTHGSRPHNSTPPCVLPFKSTRNAALLPVEMLGPFHTLFDYKAIPPAAATLSMN